MSTQLLQDLNPQPRFIQFSQLTERSQSQLQGRRFFAAYVNTETNQYGGVRQQTLLIAETEMHARKYEREFPMYQLVVGIPSQINPAVQPQALKAEKIGPAFDSSQSIQKPAHKEPIEAIQKPAHLCGVEVFTPPFQFGDRVVRDHDLYTFGTVVGMVFHPSTHEPYWEFFVQWDSNLPGNTVSETPCVPVQGYGYTYWHGKPKTASYYDADAILKTGEVYVCSTCGERHLSDTGVCDRCQELEDLQ